MRMNKRISVSQSVSFLWLTETRYPVAWAHNPEEVPPWDPSRGFPFHKPVVPTNLPRGNELEVLRNLLKDNEWEPKPPPTDGYPRLVRVDLTRPAYTFSPGHPDAPQEALALNRLL